MIDTDMKKIAAMVAFILSMFLSCQSMKVGVKAMTSNEVNISSLPYTPLAIDTTKLISNAQSLHLEPEIKTLIKQNDTELDPKKLQELNLQWQEFALRVIDSARNRKKGKDSALILLKSIQNESRTNQKENNAKFKEVLAAKNLNTDTYSMFETLGTICFVTIIASYIIVGVIWMIKRYKKSPVL